MPPSTTIEPLTRRSWATAHGPGEERDLLAAVSGMSAGEVHDPGLAEIPGEGRHRPVAIGLHRAESRIDARAVLLRAAPLRRVHNPRQLFDGRQAPIAVAGEAPARH